MRARNKIYHPRCFSCDACSKPLLSGDEFALRDDQLFCKVCTPSPRVRAAADLDTQSEVLDKSPFLQELSPTADSSISPLSTSNSSSLSGAGSTGATASKLRLSGEFAAAAAPTSSALRVRDAASVHISAH